MHIMEKFKKGLILVNVRTEEQAKKFIKLCNSYGIGWLGKESNNITYYHEYKKNTYYKCCHEKYLLYGNTRDIKFLNIQKQVITYDEFKKEYLKNIRKRKGNKF